MLGFLKFTGGRRRGSVTLAALLAYLGATIGVPVPGSVEKDHSQRYPCEHHACGCATAEQCWKSCCCFSPREKLAWAKANHVAPPDELLAQVDVDFSLGSRSGSCCSRHGQTAAANAGAKSHDCKSQHAERHAAANCSAKGNCQHHGEKAGLPADGNNRGFTLVIGALARHCQGLSDLWTVGAPTLPPDTVAWEYSWDAIGWIQPNAASFYCGALTPPVPPPRLA